LIHTDTRDEHNSGLGQVTSECGSRAEADGTDAAKSQRARTDRAHNARIRASRGRLNGRGGQPDGRAAGVQTELAPPLTRRQLVPTSDSPRLTRYSPRLSPTSSRAYEPVVDSILEVLHVLTYDDALPRAERGRHDWTANQLRGGEG
jgi:hypothetical protein